jgi:hypothetical protein
MKPRIRSALFGLLLGMLCMPCAGAGESPRLEAGLRGRFAQEAPWQLRQWLRVEVGPWRGGLALRRNAFELGERPHLAAWLERSSAPGGRWLLGSWSLGDESGALLGSPRAQPFGAPLRARLHLRPGTASGWRAEETGLGWQRHAGAIQGGLWASRTWRDRRADGQGFVLDMERSPRNRSRIGAWQDELALGWLSAEAPGGIDALMVVGRRRASQQEVRLAALTLVSNRAPERRALAVSVGRHRLVRLQWMRTLAGLGNLRLEAWGGRLGDDPWSRPALPLGGGRSAGAEGSLEGRLGALRLAAGLRLLRGDATGEEGPGWERRLRLGRGWRSVRGAGVVLTGDWLRRDAGAQAEDRWLLQLSLQPARGQEIVLQRRGVIGPEGTGQASGLRVDTRPAAGLGLRMQWLRFTGGRSTYLARLPWPGSGWLLAGSEGRESLGAGCWFAVDGRRLALAAQRDWRADSAPGWSVQCELSLVLGRKR